MKFVCEQSVLLKLLNDVCRCVASRSTVPALEGIHITVSGQRAIFESFNIEFGVKTSIEVSDAEDGTIVVPSKIFTDIVKKLPDSLVSISSEKLNVSINCADSNFSISAFDPTDFPNLPSIEDEKAILISSDVVKNMIKQTIFAVSTNNERDVYCGELIETSNGTLTIIALDGFRMSVRKEQVNIDSNFKIIVPGKALSEVLRLLPTDNQDIELYLSERYIFFKFNDYIFLSRLLEGSFADCNSLIPSLCETKVRVNVQSMIESLERVSVIIDDRLQFPVRGKFQNNSVVFSCSTSLGNSSDEISIDMQGSSIEIAFNDRYMVEALKHCDTDEVYLEMTSPLKPIKIVPIEGDSFLFLVLPVRLRENL